MTAAVPQPRRRAGTAESEATRPDEARTDAVTALWKDVVHRARVRSSADRALLWILDEGEVEVIADDVDGREAATPRADVVEALLAAPRAIDLGQAQLPHAIRNAAGAARATACVVLRGPSGAAAAVLLLGGNSDPAGRVRPRTLAALDAWARQLEPAIGGALAARHLEGLDSRIQRLDRLATLGGLLADVVHELRNPLVSVKTFLQLLPERRDDPGFFDEYQPLVAEEMQRLERMLESVMRHARTSAPSEAGTEPEILRDCVDSTLRLLAARARHAEVTVAASFDSSLPSVTIGEDALRQVLLNLCLNALAVTPAGGRVEVRVARSRDRLVLCVDDSGPGVPSELRESIFRPFVTSREGSSGGLGLAITRRIVREAGGEVAVGDAPLGGARFALRLPTVGAEKPEGT